MEHEFTPDVCDLVGRSVNVVYRHVTVAKGLLTAVTKKYYTVARGSKLRYIDRGPGVVLEVYEKESEMEMPRNVATCMCGHSFDFTEESVFGIALDDNLYVRCLHCGEKVDVTAQIPESWNVCE